MIRTIDLATFKESFLQNLKNRGAITFEAIKNEVQDILENVKQKGDQALIQYEKKFDKVDISENDIRVTSEEIEDAYKQVSSDILEAIRQIIKNIAVFHEAQKRDLWFIETVKGVSVGQIMRPLERVGVYIPGGKALYPSTVLMTVVPAKIAGVKEVILCTPPRPDGSVHPVILVAAQEVGVDTIYKAGGVQAIGAMAFGTETIQAVNKIVGPGNKYVNAAKLIVSISVGIDLPAGPSEVLILADETSNPNYIAIDLLSQAEHDENTYCILIATSKKLVKAVEQALSKLTAEQPRKLIIEKALKDNGYIVVVENIAEAINLTNEIAPEHLELQIKGAESILPQINNAGAIFIGDNSPVPVGDYAAGSNHVLPTGGSAKIYSGLSIFSFMKLIDVTKCTLEGIKTLAPWIQALAEIEGLEAHNQAVQMRCTK
jgi:histidinol dehydrogenase